MYDTTSQKGLGKKKLKKKEADLSNSGWQYFDWKMYKNDNCI